MNFAVIGCSFRNTPVALRERLAFEQAALPARENVTEEPLVLESTEAGYRLYRRLGFRDVTNYTVYLTR